MGKITRFEDLICWQKARKLVNGVYSVTNTGLPSQDYGLKDPLRRLVVSINLARDSRIKTIKIITGLELRIRRLPRVMQSMLHRERRRLDLRTGKLAPLPAYAEDGLRAGRKSDSYDYLVSE